VDGVEEACFGNDMVRAAARLDNGCDLDICPGHWYALYVRSRHEKVVESGLKGKGYSAFSPFYRTKRKRVDRITAIDVPLFPGYVFCHFDSTKRLPILTTPGVVGVVGPRNRPEPVDDHEIASIRTIALSGRPVQPWPFLRSGQRIRLQAGPRGASTIVNDDWIPAKNPRKNKVASGCPTNNFLGLPRWDLPFHDYGLGMTAFASLEYALSVPFEFTPVTT
jgi:transcription termination/antitermination protein NusG